MKLIIKRLDVDIYLNHKYPPKKDIKVKGRARIKAIWTNMIRRCYTDVRTIKNIKYEHINVCDDWRYDFNNFYTWAINNGYEDDLTIDRIHNDLNYQPVGVENSERNLFGRKVKARNRLLKNTTSGRR